MQASSTTLFHEEVWFDMLQDSRLLDVTGGGRRHSSDRSYPALRTCFWAGAVCRAVACACGSVCWRAESAFVIPRSAWQAWQVGGSGGTGSLF